MWHQANWNFANAAQSFIGLAAPRAPVVFRATQERGLFHVEHICLERFTALLPVQFPLVLLGMPAQLPLRKVDIASQRGPRLLVPLLEDRFGEVLIDAPSTTLIPRATSRTSSILTASS